MSGALEAPTLEERRCPHAASDAGHLVRLAVRSIDIDRREEAVRAQVIRDGKRQAWREDDEGGLGWATFDALHEARVLRFDLTLDARYRIAVVEVTERRR